MRERIGAATGVAAYLAGVAATTAVLLEHAGTAVPARPVSLAVAFAAVGAAAGAGGYRRVEAIHRPRTSAAFLAVPATTGATVLGLELLGGGALGSRPPLAIPWLATLLAASGVVVLRRTASTLRAQRLAAEALFLVELPTTTRTPSRRVRTGVAVLGIAALAVARVGGWSGWPLLAPVAAGLLGVALLAPREIWITEAGVRLESLGGTRVLAWDSFERFYLGEQLVLLRAGPLRRDLAFDAEAVSGPALAVLGDLLARSEQRGVPSGGLDASVGESPEPAGS